MSYIKNILSNRERSSLFRKRFYILFLKRLYRLPALLMLLVKVSTAKLFGVEVGDFSVIEDFLFVANAKNLIIGSETFVGKAVHFALHDQIKIGTRVVINSGVKILTASHSLSDSQWRMYSKPVIVDDYAWIATDAILLPGSHVGYGAVVGAGAVVRGRVEPFDVVAGNPAVKMGRRKEPLNYHPTFFTAPIEAWIGKNFETHS